MPKVPKEYFTQKEDSIVAAAIRVCESKPAYAVTLRDIAREAKISTGGMYNYFTSIDEIFARILNMAYGEFSFADEIADIFDSDKPPEQIITLSFAVIGKMIDGLYVRFGNMISEVAYLYTTDDERRKKLEELTQINDELSEFYQKLESFIDTGITDGRFKLKVPKEQVLFLVANSIEALDDGVGFVRDNAKRFGVEVEKGMEAEKTMTILAHVIVDLLRIENIRIGGKSNEFS